MKKTVSNIALKSGTCYECPLFRKKPGKKANEQVDNLCCNNRVVVDPFHPKRNPGCKRNI